MNIELSLQEYYPATPTFTTDEEYNSSCPETYIPFRVYNLITEKYVDVKHKDIECIMGIHL